MSLRTEKFAWREWSVPDDADSADLAVVKAANPSSWITPELLAERYESPSMTTIDWKRFFCNQWVTRAEAEAVIDPQVWAKAADPDAVALPGCCFAIDAPLDRSSAAIAVAAFVDGDRVLIDICEHGSGSAWVIERLIELCRVHNPVGIVVDPGGPAWLTDLKGWLNG